MYFTRNIFKAFLLLFFILNAVDLKAQINELGSWNILNIKFKQKSKIDYFFEAQIRSLSFYNNFHYHELKAGLDYKVNKNLKLTLGLGDYNTYSEGGNFKTPLRSDEIRLWPQITVNQELGKFTLDHRYRYELRFTDKGLNGRFRYRFGITKNFKKKNSTKQFLKTSIYNEIFFTSIEPFFVRNRASLQISKNIHSGASILVGFINQSDYKVNDETGRNFFLLGYYLEF